MSKKKDYNVLGADEITATAFIRKMFDKGFNQGYEEGRKSGYADGEDVLWHYVNMLVGDLNEEERLKHFCTSNIKPVLDGSFPLKEFTARMKELEAARKREDEEKSDKLREKEYKLNELNLLAKDLGCDLSDLFNVLKGHMEGNLK